MEEACINDENIGTVWLSTEMNKTINEPIFMASRPEINKSQMENSAHWLITNIRTCGSAGNDAGIHQRQAEI